MDEETLIPMFPPPGDEPTTQAGVVPRVSFLGWCDRAAEVREGHPAFWHTSILGLSRVRVSYLYPRNLKGDKIAVAIYQPQVGEAVDLLLRPTKTNQKPLEIKLNILGAAQESVHETTVTSTQIPPGTALPGWVFLIFTVGDDVIAFEPDNYNVFLVDSKKELYLGSVDFVHAGVNPFTAEDIAAIRSDPLALKSVRLAISCKLCGGTLRTYSGIEKSPKLETEGWVWHELLPERFRCDCGEVNFGLKPLRTGLHGLLRRHLAPASTFSADVDKLYKRSALEEYCRRFLQLLNAKAREEEMQSFLEGCPVFFSMFLPERLMSKKPVLSKYIADFGVLNERKELLLIEIERPDLVLLKKDGGIRAELQHAVDQVRRWMQEFDDHRAAALDCLGLKLDEVARIRGVVVAGRTPKDEEQERILRAVSWPHIEFYTYDDLLKSVTELVRQVAAT